MSDRPPLADLPPPTGTVAFLFTDIEGSTQLWEEQPQAMAMALRRHDDLVRTAVQARGGHVFSTGGDGFAVAFPTVADALQAAVDVQRNLLGDDAFEAEFRVRMGLHAGAAVERDGDYFGPVVNRAARIMAAAHGGQILVSAGSRRDAGPGRSRHRAARARRRTSSRTCSRPSRSSRPPQPACPATSRRCGRAGPATSHVRGPWPSGATGSSTTSSRRCRRGRLVTVVSPVARSAVNLSFAVVRSVEERFPFGSWHLDLATLGGRAELVPALAAMLGVSVESPRRGRLERRPAGRIGPG